MHIASIAAGAAGMYCGSCIRDNTLATALKQLGHDCLLVPTYTPLRLDEADASMNRVFMGGINVYLEQLSPGFDRLPSWLTDWLDSPGLLRWVSRFASMTAPSDLGEMTVSMLRGAVGRQQRELAKLVDFLANEVRPELVNLPNAMFVAFAAPIKERLGVPVAVTVSGEDLFLDGLPEPYRSRAIALIRRQIRDCDAVIATSRYYADEVIRLLGAPRERTYAVPLGVKMAGHGGPRPGEMRPPTVGFLARQCPAKGLHILLEALPILRARPGTDNVKFRIAGYLGDGDRPYVDKLQAQLAERGLTDAVEFVGELDRAGKVRFLQEIDVFSVPTVYRESKGLPVIEALANGTPVVQPAHGAFVEMVETTGGGRLFRPSDAADLAEKLHELLTNPTLARRLGETGRQYVHAQHTDVAMAEATLAVYQQMLHPAAGGRSGSATREMRFPAGKRPGLRAWSLTPPPAHSGPSGSGAARAG